MKWIIEYQNRSNATSYFIHAVFEKKTNPTLHKVGPRMVTHSMYQINVKIDFVAWMRTWLVTYATDDAYISPVKCFLSFWHFCFGLFLRIHIHFSKAMLLEHVEWIAIVEA